MIPALVVVGAFLIGAQVVSKPVTVPLTPIGTEGLSGTSVVNLDSASIPGAVDGGYFPIPGSGLAVLYTVPDDKWLLLTDVEFISNPYFELVEVVDEAVTVKRQCWFNFGNIDSQLSYHSRVGLAFAPGSAVVLRSTVDFAQPVRFTMTGFLTRP